MTDLNAAFVAAINADPTNALHGAIYAAWLEEQGDPDSGPIRRHAERIACLADETPVYRVVVDYDDHYSCPGTSPSGPTRRIPPGLHEDTPCVVCGNTLATTER